MSEPRNRAESIAEIAPGLWHWSIHDERIEHRSDAYAVASTSGLVLVDPLPVAPSALAALGPIAAICLTSASHQRAAWSLRAQHSVAVHAPRGARGLEEAADQEYAEDAQLPGGLRANLAPGPAAPHYALLLPSATEPVPFSGDLIMLFDDGTARLLPEPHLVDPEAGQRSARALAGLGARVLCPAHGAPCSVDATGRILQALEHAG